MQDFFTFYTDCGRVFDLPARVLRDGQVFVRDHPRTFGGLVITKVRLTSLSFNCPIQFILESFSLIEGEAGRWTISANEENGEMQYDLEYYATEQFGQRVRSYNVFRWDHQKDEMVVA